MSRNRVHLLKQSLLEEHELLQQSLFPSRRKRKQRNRTVINESTLEDPVDPEQTDTDVTILPTSTVENINTEPSPVIQVRKRLRKYSPGKNDRENKEDLATSSVPRHSPRLAAKKLEQRTVGVGCMSKKSPTNISESKNSPNPSNMDTATGGVGGENDDGDPDYLPGDDLEDAFDALGDLSQVPQRPQDVLMEYLYETNRPAHDRYIEVRDYIEEHKPQLDQVLLTDLLLPDRVLLFQMYEISCLLNYPSQDYLDYQKRFDEEFIAAKHRYLDYQQLSEEVKATYDEEKEKLARFSSALPLDYQIINLDASEKIKAYIFREYQRMQHLSSRDDERPKLARWIDTCISIPYRRYKELPSDNRSAFLREMKAVFDREVYGMEKVKEQLLVFANARMSNPKMKESTLGLVGPPGIGKTMIARLLAVAMNFPFAQISCGGISTADTLKGYAYTYIGSRPGEITNALIEMKYNSGILFLDEFEKIAKSSSISSMLLHVLDPLQNSQYQDNYLGREITIDISGIWFVLSMNELPQDSALRDRIYVIQMEGYNETEKIQIAKRHLVPKIFDNLKISHQDIVFSEDTLRHVIQHYSTKTPGVRPLNHSLRELIAKLHFLQQTDLKTSFSLGKNKKIEKPCQVTNEIVQRLLPPAHPARYLDGYN